MNTILFYSCLALVVVLSAVKGADAAGKPEPDYKKLGPIRDGPFKMTVLETDGRYTPVSRLHEVSQAQRTRIVQIVDEALSKRVPDETVRDFDDDVITVAKAMTSVLGLFGGTPKVISVNGSDSQLPHRIFNKYKVKGTVVSQHSFDPMFSPVKPTTVVTKWVHNHLLANNTESVISEEVTRKTSTSTSMTSTVGGSVTASISVNFWVASASASASVGGSFSTTSSTEQEDVKTFMLQDTITVSPKSSAKVVWNIMERSMKLGWDAELKIQGHFAIKSPADKLFFVPVSVLPYFIKDGKYKRTNVTDVVATTISGIMQSEMGTESTVTTIDFPLQVDDRNIDKCNDGMTLEKAVKQNSQDYEAIRLMQQTEL